MIVVVGTGRSGTSYAARQLIEQGVNMGSLLNHHAEDADFHNLDQWRLAGKITPAQWEHGVAYIASTRREPWGFKDPRTAHFIPDIEMVLRPSRYIWVQRDLEEAARSMEVRFGWAYREALDMMRFRWDMLDHHLPRERTTICQMGDRIDARPDSDQGHAAAA